MPSLRATRMLGAQKAQSGHCTVVFDPRVVSTLLAVVASALSGEAVVKGRSFFAGRIGESVAVGGVTLVDDPTDSRAYGAASHDGEGLACRRNVLISEGVLRMFVFDTVSARRAGTVSTGSAVRGGFAGTPSAGCRALVLAPGALGHDEIVAAVGDGLYVQSITGVHSGVNPVSGDFSVGAEGLKIEGGALGAAGAGGDRRLHAAAHAAVGGRGRRRPALAPRRGGGPDPGHRRHGPQRRLTLSWRRWRQACFRRPSRCRPPSRSPSRSSFEFSFEGVDSAPGVGRGLLGFLAPRAVGARGGPRVRLVEPAALQDDADVPVHLAQRGPALGALGQRVVREALDGFEPVPTCRACVFVGRQWTPPWRARWHSLPETAKSIRPARGSSGVGRRPCQVVDSGAVSDRMLANLDPLGGARMVDVTPREPTHRRALARCRVSMLPETTTKVANNAITKGDVLAAARIAGIQAAKRTAELIPMCHPVLVGSIGVNFSIGDDYVEVEAQVETVDRTGVEMEAMTACAVAALTVYDMCKSSDRTMTIEHVALWEKFGGRSGPWRRAEANHL